jgi:threonine dehydrogenase-like Zn-dependent dehydrogenase
VVAKAWEQVTIVGKRAFWEPQRALVTGAGPIGLLAALIGRLHGLAVHVLDRVTSGPKPDLVKSLGATYHSGAMADLGFEPDIIIECTGRPGDLGCFNTSAPAAPSASPVGSGGRLGGVVADVASAVVLNSTSS